MTRTLWAGGALICLASLLLYGFGMNSPNPLRWSALAVLVMSLTALWVWRGMRIPDCPLSWAVMAFVAYAGLSLLWSPDWREGLIRYQSIVLLAGLLLAALHANRKSLIRAVSLGAGLAIGIEITISYFQPGIYGGLGNENFQAEFLVIAAPLAFMNYRSPLCVIAGVAALAQAFLFNASDAKYAALAAVFVLGLGWVAKRGHRAVAASMALAGIVALWLTFDRFVYSLGYRVEFVINTALMWLDRPFLGTGLGGFNYTYPDYQEGHTTWISPGADGTAIHNINNFIGAAHNEYLQALATFGAIGAAYLLAILWLGPRQNIGAITALAAAAGLAAIGFPMQNPATAVPIVLAFALSARPCSPLFSREWLQDI